MLGRVAYCFFALTLSLLLIITKIVFASVLLGVICKGVNIKPNVKYFFIKETRSQRGTTHLFSKTKILRKLSWCISVSKC